MRAYIIRRLLVMIPTALLVSLIVFVVTRLVPGTMVDIIVAGAEDAIDREMIEHRFGLDVPIPVQYGRWMGFLAQADGSFNGVLQGNLGVSWWTQTPVTSMMRRAYPVTFVLGLLALIIGQIIALPIGIYSAIRQETAGDYLSRSLAILFISVPGFWLGTLVIVFASVWWGYMPPLSLVRFSENPLDSVRQFLVPASLLGMGLCGTAMRLTRTMMLEVLRQDYIRTAWSKGLRERVVVLRHALKNALIPLVTQVGNQVPFVFGGTVIIEQIFLLPGLGSLIVNGVTHRDYPLISGVMLVVSAVIMVTNLIVDLLYAKLDPRVQYS